MQQHDDNEDVFGFESVRGSAKDKIRQIKPSAPPEPPADFTRVDEIAGNAGFISREASAGAELAPRRGRPRAQEPFEALNMRVPSSLANAFRGWCLDNRYSYPAALAEIMRQAGIPTK